MNEIIIENQQLLDFDCTYLCNPVSSGTFILRTQLVSEFLILFISVTSTLRYCSIYLSIVLDLRILNLMINNNSLKSNAQRVHGKHIQVIEELLQSWYLKEGKVESILTSNIYDLTEL